MIGAIIGDIVGSRFEFNNHRSKDFELFTADCFPTDDSIMTVAIGQAIVECQGDYSNLSRKAIECMQDLGRPYPPLRIRRKILRLDIQRKSPAV